MKTGNAKKLLIIAGLAAALCVSAYVQTRGINRPLRSYRDANGVAQGHLSSNYTRYGLLSFHLLPLFDKSPSPELTPFFRIKYKDNPYFLLWDDRVALAHYPPMLSLTLYAGYRILGESPATTRLVPIIATLLMLTILFFTVRLFAGAWTALTAVFLYALSPVILAYGQMPDTIIFIMLFFMLALYCYLRWDADGGAWRLAGVFLFTAAGCSYGWFAYFVVPALLSHHLLTRRLRISWPFFFGLPFVAGLCVASFVVYLLRAIGPDALNDWLHAYALRGGKDVVINGTHYPITLFQFFKTMLLRVAFHFTWPVFLAALIWLAGLKRGAPWRGDRPAVMAVAAMSVFAVCPYIIFRQGAYVHGFYMFLVGPAVCTAAAIVIVRAFSLQNKWKALAVAALLMFVFTIRPRYEAITSYLHIEKAEDFARLIESVSDPHCIIGQDIYDLSMTMWITAHTDRILMQRELSFDDTRRIVRTLPPGYRFVYIHMPLPESMRLRDTEKTLAFLYRRFGFYKKSGFMIFDSALPPKKYYANPKTTKDLSAAAAFQDKIRLLELKISPPAAHAGDTVSITYTWECLDPPEFDFAVLARIIPGVLHNDHEPMDGALLTSHWKAGEIIKETYRVSIPETAPPGSYPMDVGLCMRQDGAPLCLEPAKPVAPNEPFVRAGRLDVLPARNGAAPVMPDPVLQAKIQSPASYMEYYDLRSYRRFIDYIGVDETMKACFTGWEYLFLEQKDKALPLLRQLARRFEDYGLIEKMVPTAMQEVPVMLKGRLILIYLEKHRYLPALREAVSLAMNLPQSPQIFRLLGARLEQQALDPKSNAPQLVMAFSDYCYGRFARMRPDDIVTARIMAEHYLNTGRPLQAMQSAAKYIGSARDEDITFHILFAYQALRTRRADDYRIIRRRLAVIKPSVDCDNETYALIMKRHSMGALEYFLQNAAGPRYGEFWLRALKESYDLRDYKVLASILDQPPPDIAKLTRGQKKRVSLYYQTLGLDAYKSKAVDAIDYFERAIELEPGNTDVLMNLALMNAERGRRDKAEEYLQMLLKQNPNDADARALLKEIQQK